MSNQPVFKTNNIDLAAYLFSKDYPLVEVVQAGRYATFVFPFEASKYDYIWRDSPSAEVNAIRSFVSAKAFLFSRIRANTRGGGR